METAVVNEAELMRTCGHLYVSIALESFSTTVMCLVFAYLLLLITNRGRLSTPGSAAFNCVKHELHSWYVELAEEVSHWKEMPKLPLERRFAFCRKCNQAVCMFQLVIGFLTIERWLHINNVNGFRYLGYSLTCPPMQVQLIVLIAPVIPCYRLQCRTAFVFTMVMLWFGYAASVIPGNLYEGDLLTFLETGHLDDLKPTLKLYLCLGAICIEGFLSVFQIPYLALTYILKGGVKAELPHGYLKLLFIVWITWLAFPVWWLMSFEGMSLITDTKMNAAGFCLLNVISKAGFTLSMLSIVKWHKVEKKRKASAQKEQAQASLDVGLFTADEPSPLANNHSDASTTPGCRPSDSWLIRTLAQFDAPRGTAKDWMGLEPTYRAYLVGHGITSNAWKQMSKEQQQHLREDFGEAFDLHGREEGLPTMTTGSTSDSCHIAQSLRKGQTLTTLHGQKGRLIDIMDHEVRLGAPGKQPLFVNVEDLTVVKVSILGARGLWAADPSAQRQLYCSCLIVGMPSSEVQTQALTPEGSKVSWTHELNLFGYSAGDPIMLRLWGKDLKTRTDELLCEARVPADGVRQGVYEGEVQLEGSTGKIDTFLTVIIMTENMPWDVPEGAEQVSLAASRQVL